MAETEITLTKNMKELYVIRHAKSDWEHAHLDDFERPLNDRGLRDAPRVASVIAAKWPRPDIVISSPAIRAYQTALFFKKEWGIGWNHFHLEDSIYEATADDLVLALSRFSPKAERIALFGHNPGVSVLVNRLTNSDRELKTCCGARITTSNSEFSWMKCQLAETFRATDL